MAEPKESISVEVDVAYHRAGGYDDRAHVLLRLATVNIERETDDEGKLTGKETWTIEGFKS